MRKLFIISGLIAFSIVSLYLLLANSKKETAKVSSKENKSTLEAKTNQLNPEPIILSGTGEQATNKFKLYYPLYKITSDNPYVQADLLDGQGRNWNNYFGRKTFWHVLSYPDDYIVNVHNVDASLISSWEIRLEPIKIGDNPEARQFTGTGSKTTNLFNASEGLKIIKATHSGRGTFTVILYDDSAVTYESLGLFGKVTGQFEGSKGVQFHRDGRYFFDVEADGDWTINIEK